jgi:hypothetical protein
VFSVQQKPVDVLRQRRLLQKDVLQARALDVDVGHVAHIIRQGRAQAMVLGDDVPDPFLLPSPGLFHVLFQEGHGQRLLAGEVLVERADGDAG